jgi:ribosome-binding factor A
MRHAPTLTFVQDALPESARHLDEVLARAKALDEEAAAHRGSSYAGEADPYKKPVEPFEVPPSSAPQEATRENDEADEAL